MSLRSLARAIKFASVFAVSALVWAPNVARAEERPFMANLEGNAHLSPTDDPFVLRNDETGTGNSTHLGNFTWADTEFADFDAVPGGVEVVGSFTMTAANGDELYGKLSTVGFFDEDGNLVIHGTYRFTGGTGRFANATGTGDIDAIAYLSPGLPFTGTFAGTIDY
jgi:hypothetical protein